MCFAVVAVSFQSIYCCRSYSHANLIWTWHGSMLTVFLLVFRRSCCLISVYLMLPVGQPCQVDLDLAWLDVNRFFACVSP